MCFIAKQFYKGKWRKCITRVAKRNIYVLKEGKVSRGKWGLLFHPKVWSEFTYRQRALPKRINLEVKNSYYPYPRFEINEGYHFYLTLKREYIGWDSLQSKFKEPISEDYGIFMIPKGTRYISAFPQKNKNMVGVAERLVFVRPLKVEDVEVKNGTSFGNKRLTFKFDYRKFNKAFYKSKRK